METVSSCREFLTPEPDTPPYVSPPWDPPPLYKEYDHHSLLRRIECYDPFHLESEVYEYQYLRTSDVHIPAPPPSPSDVLLLSMPAGSASPSPTAEQTPVTDYYLLHYR